MTLDEAYKIYLKKYDTPHNDFHIGVIRLFVGVLFAWKVMSRDFGFMGIVPHDFFYFYPIQLYPPKGIILTTGIPILMELVTFHWIHWITGFPSENILTLLQFALATVALLMAIVGRGPYRIFAITVYVLATYLWSFEFLSGQEIDSVMLPFGMLLVLCLCSYDDRPIWQFGQLIRKPDTTSAGRTFSAILLVFVLYYGLSGYNKVVDLTITEWFRYNLIQDIDVTLRRQEFGNYFGAPVPQFFALFVGHEWLNYVLVPMVYISHLSIFILFFRRRHILKFAMFYTVFHFFAEGTSISFTAYIVIWWALADWRGIFVRRAGEEAPSAAT
jgi:hypothetical protein